MLQLLSNATYYSDADVLALWGARRAYSASAGPPVYLSFLHPKATARRKETVEEAKKGFRGVHIARGATGLLTRHARFVWRETHANGQTDAGERCNYVTVYCASPYEIWHMEGVDPLQVLASQPLTSRLYFLAMEKQYLIEPGRAAIPLAIHQGRRPPTPVVDKTTVRQNRWRHRVAMLDFSITRAEAELASLREQRTALAEKIAKGGVV